MEGLSVVCQTQGVMEYGKDPRIEEHLWMLVPLFPWNIIVCVALKDEALEATSPVLKAGNYLHVNLTLSPGLQRIRVEVWGLH